MAVIITASLRAMAITAFLLAARPPLAASLSPWRRRAQSGPNGPRRYWVTLNQELPQVAVAAFGDGQLSVGAAGLVAAGNQSEVGSDVAPVFEAVRIFDAQDEGQ